MVLSKDDKRILEVALNTESARLRRAANAAASVPIKELYAAELAMVQALAGRVSQEPTK